MQQIVKCAVEAGYFKDFPSPRGAEGHESRLVPTELLIQELPDDPPKFAPQQKSFVELFARKRRGAPKVSLPFDPDHPAASRTQQLLEKINSFNNQAQITFDGPRGQQLLDPTLFAKFIDSFSLHGRLYTCSRFGHQALRSEQRKTILINGEPTVELDYVACHCRIAYHEKGLDFADDPYLLWANTTEAQRALAKAMINTAFNARSLGGLVASCNRQASRYRFVTNPKKAVGSPGKSRQALKTGRHFEKAIKLEKALAESGLNFKAILPQMLAFHEPISDRFAGDWGLHFMRIDSQIALNVMHRLVAKGIPVLGIHDSFITAERHQEQLRTAMVECYRELLHFDPVIAPQSQKQKLVALGSTLKAA
jgi:hypothetical protein